MYVCLDCQKVSEESKHYVETHGFSHPPWEEWNGCCYCGGVLAETWECDVCGEYITTEEYVETKDHQKICENCYQIKNIEDS